MANWVQVIRNFVGKLGGTELPTAKSLVDLIGVRSSGTISIADTLNFQNQVFRKDITSAANAGQVTVGTVSGGAIVVKDIILKSDGATTSDFTSCVVSSGPSGTPTVVTELPASLAKFSNLNANGEQVAWSGSVWLESTDLLVITLSGTGATAVDFQVIVEYNAGVAGGIIS